MAFCAPATNSYRRLVPGYEAPVLLKHSQRNRSAAVRIPMYSSSPRAKRFEFCPADPLANPYLAFPAMLMAGLDGIERGLDPGEPIDRNLYELPREQLAAIPTVPTSVDEALAALEADHAFLTKGDVFTEDLIATYIEVRREQSDRAVRPRQDPPAPVRVPALLRRLAHAGPIPSRDRWRHHGLVTSRGNCQRSTGASRPA